MSLVITGAAGFIGMHVARALLARGETVIGVDDVNDYYDPALKEARLKAVSYTHLRAHETQWRISYCVFC